MLSRYMPSGYTGDIVYPYATPVRYQKGVGDQHHAPAALP